MAKRIDLSGMVQGKLTVLSPLPPKNGKYYWLCKCECGNTVELRSSVLKRGQQSCGCMRGINFKGVSRHDESHIGERYGMLTITAFAGTTDGSKNGSGKEALWECRCDCGNVVVKKMRNLRKSPYASCGCYTAENGHKKYHYKVGEEVTTDYSRFVIKDRFRRLKKNSNSHDKYYECECLNCHEMNVIQEATLDRHSGSCKACSMSRSYPSKFVYWFLKQLGLEFVTEFSPEWSGRYRYDYYFKTNNGDEYVIEVDGLDHYNENTRNDRLTLDNIQAVDEMKESLAHDHGISMIRLDCRYSNRDYIVNSIKSSILSELFDLNNIDWNLCIKSFGGFTS